MLRQGKLSPQVSTHRRRSSATTRAGGCSDSDRVILRSALRGSPRSSPQAEPDEAAMPQPPTCSRCVWPVIRGIARVESSHARIFEMTAEPSLGDSHWHQRRKSTGTGSSLDNGSVKGLGHRSTGHFAKLHKSRILVFRPLKQSRRHARSNVHARSRVPDGLFASGHFFWQGPSRTPNESDPFNASVPNLKLIQA
jgi:hypothetical protein